jgi:DNA-binding response OmpR family regulator
MTQSILVVDDDHSILLTLRDILSAEGFPVRLARNGKEGLASVEQDPPSLIVLDLWMPLMNGQEMARLLRKRGISTPILVMSAIQAGNQIAEEIDAAGFIATSTSGASPGVRMS